jgi:nitrilase
VGDGSVKVAVVQRPPVLLDRDACVKVAVEAIAEVAAAGAVLAVFPETFIPGYPAWMVLRPGGDYELASEIHARLLDNSIDLSTDELAPVQDAAARNAVVVVCGIHERDGSFSRATVYNTLVTIGADGTVLNRHRKLVPTNPERMVWGQGDASGLRVIASAGRLAGDLLGKHAAGRDAPTPRACRSAFDSDSGRCVAGYDAASPRGAAQYRLRLRPASATYPQLPSASRWPESGQRLNPETRSSSHHRPDVAGCTGHDILYADIDATSQQACTARWMPRPLRPDIFTLTVDRSPAID